ncbi:MAG: CoA transferase subunit A [Candidatus Thorarchaeota archaeon]
MSVLDKRVKLSDSLQTIKSGDIIGIGGFSLNNSPMALIRELIRNDLTDLTIIGAVPLGIQIDILLGAEVVKKVICPAIGMEGYGSAPNFVRACKNGMVEFVPCDVGYTMFGLRAAAENLPFHPYPLNVVENTDIIQHNKDFRKIFDPFHNQEVVVVPPLKPDVALIHSQAADASGNCLYQGSRAADDLLAEAAKMTIVSVDEIVPREWVRQNPMSTTIPRHFISAVVDIPFAAHPCASHGMYRVDELHLKKYMQLAQTQSGFKEYLDNMVLEPKIKNHYAYLRASGGKDYLDKLKQ